jgi:feruloyl esterase
MGGGGGFAGSVQNSVEDANFTGGRTALERGYATAGTDTGHTGSGIDASWALANDRAKQDFAGRAVHRTAEISKQIITAYYHRRPQYSYFGGCSRGGGQGLTLAQRYPSDFDGIIAGAPTLDWTGMIAEFIRNQQAVFPDPRDLTTPAITAHNLRLLADAVRKRCDGLDEVLDGVITDPRRCKFDPASLPICALTPGPHCLTQKQLAAIQTIYSDLVIAGRRVYPGLPFGGEDIPGLWDRWITRADPPAAPGIPNMHHAIATQFAKYFVFEDPSWTYASYDFSDWLERAAASGKLLDAKDPDLRKFKARGGKLLMFHGWSDPALPATRTIEYFESVANIDPQLSAFVRLYLMPGVGHCRGGVGPDRVDWITALENWVERDHRPAELLATKLDAGGVKLLDRPLCPYPDVAQYDRIGNVNAARSFRCVASK